ncbi:hypothetical protein [Negadavirga shengliensis]|uniref:Uncharacterized protein n=1 Tax=Negadavirga shengliensis TaxID=1389218 RepID=A0ABV9T1W0_9BACT
MNKTRAIILAAVLMVICAGYMIKAYFGAPEDFSFKDHIALMGVLISMVMFITGHLIDRNTGDENKAGRE